MSGGQRPPPPSTGPPGVPQASTVAQVSSARVSPSATKSGLLESATATRDSAYSRGLRSHQWGTFSAACRRPA